MQHSKQFLNVISFKNLYEAHRRARRCKRNKKEVIEFELNLSKNLWQLHYDLLYGKYKTGGYHKFMIYDPKEREIQAISYRDRIVQHSLCDNFLTPLLERRLCFYNVACRKKKGTFCAIKAVKNFMCEHYKKYNGQGYILKADIKKYFNTIDHDILKQKLSSLFIPHDLKELLFSIIDGYEFSSGRGLPMGNQSSQSFALLYLDSTDRLIAERFAAKGYLRYMDDMLAFFEEKDKASAVLVKLDEFIKEQRIELNKKSQIMPFKNGTEFLGWRFFTAKNGKVVQKMKCSVKKRILKKVRYNVYLVKIGKKSAQYLNSSRVSYFGFLLKANAHFFIDRLLKIYNVA